MQLHYEVLPNNPNRIAILYGPLVLAAELGSDNLLPNNQQAIGSDHHSYYLDPVLEVPSFVADSPEEVLHCVQRADDRKLLFQTVDVGHPTDVSLIPFYQLHHQRYSVYVQLDRGLKV